VSAARELVAYSDAIDQAEARARAAWSEGYRAAATATYPRAFAEGYAACDAELAVLWRAVAEPVAHGGPSYAVVERERWHLCCLPCRRAGHRAGCRDCQDRTRETFAEPMPGDYRGGPIVRGAAA
jgi:hypothetical protein